MDTHPVRVGRDNIVHQEVRDVPPHLLLKEDIKVAYTPELSQRSSCTLRRIAWSHQIPMTKAIEMILTEYSTKNADKDKVCEMCRDKSKCDDCYFSKLNVLEKEGVINETDLM